MIKILSTISFLVGMSCIFLSGHALASSEMGWFNFFWIVGLLNIIFFVLGGSDE